MLHVSCAQSVADLAPHKHALHPAFCHGALRAGAGMLAQGKGAVLRQCAWLLQLAALQLHRADLAVLAHREDCKRLLTSLYDVAPAAADAGMTILAISAFSISQRPCHVPHGVIALISLPSGVQLKVMACGHACKAITSLCPRVCRRGWRQRIQQHSADPAGRHIHSQRASAVRPRAFPCPKGVQSDLRI